MQYPARFESQIVQELPVNHPYRKFLAGSLEIVVVLYPNLLN